MPIKPENRKRYPDDWKQVRERILKRARYRCEHPGCKARQYSVGRWANDELGWRWCAVWGQNDNQRTYKEACQVAAETYFDSNEEGPKPTVIVLTIAHLDHRPENCDDSNLRAWCQRHHLAHDADHHRANAQATRRQKAGTLELF